MSLPERFNHEDTAQLTAMIKDTKQLDHVQKPFSADQWRSSSPAVMLGTALLLAVVAFVVWKKCYAQPLQTATTTGQPEHQPRAHFLLNKRRDTKNSHSSFQNSCFIFIIIFPSSFTLP
jgi:hypothetical protein